MIYLEKFVFPTWQDEETILSIRACQNGGAFGYIDNSYPCGLFTEKELQQLDFDKITILYGGNGSGKSTILNLIANKIGLKNVTPFNTSEMIDLFISKCKYSLGFDDYGDDLYIPEGSKIIKSDDIFDYMLAIRSNNSEISDATNDLRDEYSRLKFGETIKLNGIEDFDKYRLQVLSRKKSLSRRRFLQQTAGKEIQPESNGETALSYFETKLKDNCLYLLDEPENSLSPKMCLKLKDFLETKARYCNCQFIIATHSPFMLSLKGAKIYDLDSVPVDIKNWWELENSKIYFDYFWENKDLFLKNK